MFLSRATRSARTVSALARPAVARAMHFAPRAAIARVLPEMQGSRSQRARRGASVAMMSAAVLFSSAAAVAFTEEDKVRAIFEVLALGCLSLLFPCYSALASLKTFVFTLVSKWICSFSACPINL